MARNNKIFENRYFTVNNVVYKTLILYQNWKDIHRSIGKKKTLIIPLIAEDTPTRWFDGAEQRSGTLSGAGGLIRTKKNLPFQMDFLVLPGNQHKG